MLGYPVKPYVISLYEYDYVAVKAPMFSFTRLRGADPTLGVEMSSTGEVACFGSDVQEAFLQALLATTFKLPEKSPDKYILVSIAEEKMRAEFLDSIIQLSSLGFQLCGTPGTAEYYTSHGVTMKSLSKPSTETVIDPGSVRVVGDDDTVLSWIYDKRVDLVINIPEGSSKRDEISSGYLMRRAAVDFGTSLLTNIKCAVLFCDALHRNKALPCRSIEEFVGAPTVGI
jgi:carbamoyl-phosphate synthase/aspartate carbamoyltransferase